MVVRHLRFRPGDISGAEVDGVTVASGARRVILDHCSAGWSVDESLSLSSDVADVTVQWCLIAEALNRSVHRKGPHGYGSLVRATGGVTLHHNLWAHNDARNPRLGDDYGRPPWPLFDVRNNVIYDYGAIASGMTGDNLRANYVGNYVRPGPVQRHEARGRRPHRHRGRELPRRGQRRRRVGRRSRPTTGGSSTASRRAGAGSSPSSRSPFDTPPVRTTDAASPAGGAGRRGRHAAPARRRRREVVREVESRTGRIIDSQKDVGGWPAYASGPAPADADADGMPDDWERARRLDPADPADGPAPAATARRTWSCT